jgi:hypothetical protein
MNATNDSVTEIVKLADYATEIGYMTTFQPSSYLENYLSIFNDSADFNSTFNGTFVDHAPTLTKASLIRATILACMAVISLLGNIATIWSIHKVG